MRSDRNVLLGYEMGTGRPVEVPVRHMAVTGITQESGKTTTLEALIGRSGLRAVTFVTKRAEGAFTGARRIPAYFREHADWMFVSSLLEAFLQQKMKFERSWIMRVSKGAQTLRQVQSNLAKAMESARAGLDESVYFTLSEYLEALVPEIETLPYSKQLDLKAGINVIDVSEYSMHLQGLVIRSVVEWIYERETGVIALIPEAWEFVPQRHNSPAKAAVVQLVRKGAAAGNYVWLDSQDLAGVDKEIIKQVSVYILGVQREANEVKRTLLHLPAGSRKPKPEQIMQLGRGWFYASFGHELRCTYVQPAWLDEDPGRAQRYAAFEGLPGSYVGRPEPRAGKQAKAETKSAAPETKPAQPETTSAIETSTRKPMEHEITPEMMIAAIVAEVNAVFKAEYAETDLPLYKFLGKCLRELKAFRLEKTSAPPAATSLPAAPIDVDAIVAQVLARLKASPELAALQVNAERPELNVAVQRKVIELDGSTLRGRLAQMIAEGFFSENRTGHGAFVELQRRGSGTSKPNVYRELATLAEWGFVTRESDGGFRAVEGMKINIREVAA